MNVTRQNVGTCALFIVEGQVDMHTSPDLRRHLREALEDRQARVAVDLAGVSFIDSSGLATLIEALQAVRKYGGSLRLCGLNPNVKNLFRLSNLTSIFDLRDNRDLACKD
jgi:anti-sigma B factor antagonist